MVAVLPAPVELGQLVRCRDRHWVVSDVVPSQLPVIPAGDDRPEPQTLVTLSSVEDDGLGESVSVVWELEPGAQALATATLPDPVADRFDPPGQLAAFLDAVRWGAVTSADVNALQAPFRAGITLEDYQLDPVVRALEMPRVNLGIFDDVGLGKTVEAGLVIQELLLRHRARTTWVVCPPNLALKWQAEMQEKFGLEFRIVNSQAVRDLRRERGLAANIFTHYPRLIISLDWLRLAPAQKILDQVLPMHPGYPRRFDILVVDEVHQCAPAGRGKYATDSLRTRTLRRLAPHFEHRLFLSATPHNGYLEAYTALLELLDPQRFARGVEPTQQAQAQSVVRRLKSTLREDPELGLKPDGTPRFAKRVIEPLEVDYPAAEVQAQQLLVRYTQARRRQAAKQGRGAETTAEFVTLLLKKRMLSSPEAFARTLAVHRATLARSVAATTSVEALFERLDEEEFDDDAELGRATEDALAAAAVELGAIDDEGAELLDQLQTWAIQASDRPDAKTELLLAYIDEWLRPKGAWNRERLIVFTEYRDTQAWLQRLLDARGIPASRVAYLYGGMDEQTRERIKREFQADPDLTEVRILVATDAASEGIDLQRHCRRLVHMEIPFNPNRLEQRNGRIDRHLQPSPEVTIHHFVPSDFAEGSLAADMQFLSIVARKIEAIRDDLGSVGEVLGAQVQEAMLGHRTRIDEEALSSTRTRKAKAQLARLERGLRERFQFLHQKVVDSREELGITPQAVHRAVGAGLRLGRQAPLSPIEVPAMDGWPAVEGFVVPQLTRSWASAAADLHDPIRGIDRPITFDQSAAGRDDVVLAHLGSRIVAQSLRLLRAQIWATGADARISRVTAQLTSDPQVTDVTAIAHARLVITGADGRRLHEEVIYAGGRVPAQGRFARIDSLTELRTAISAASGDEPSMLVREQLEAAWVPRVRDPLYQALQARFRDKVTSLERTLAKAGEREKADIASNLTELRNSILAGLGEVEREVEQLRLDFGGDEQRQAAADIASLRSRAEAIPDEILREQELIDRRYGTIHPLLFPAAVTFVVPVRFASEWA